jgi:hypothetical protein
MIMKRKDKQKTGTDEAAAIGKQVVTVSDIRYIARILGVEIVVYLCSREEKADSLSS